jgi:spore germination protein YaaH
LIACAPEPVTSDIAARSWAYVIPASLRAGDPAGRLKGYDVLCYGVYRLGAAGRIATRPGFPAVLRESRRGRKLYALVALSGRASGARMLASPGSRAMAVRELARLAADHSYDGLHIDFEGPDERSLTGFADFLRELRSTEVMQGRVLSIAVFPALHRHPREAAFHDLSVLGPLVDQIVIMTYDYHLETPGPVTDLQWAERNVRIARKHVAPERIWLGVPAYGYEWKTSRHKGRPAVITEKTGASLCGRYNCERHASGMLQLKRPGRVAFVPDSGFYASMNAIVRRHGLRGTALWRIGFEIAP